jgi:formamidopyrimidine-DNA glycosylase
MPELPEVETVCRGLSPLLTGNHFTQVTLNRPDLRIPFPDGLAASIEHKKILHIARRAKYILIFFEDTSILVIHLGMSGRIITYPAKRNRCEKHDHVIFDVSNGKEVAFNDPRRFGLVTLTNKAGLASHPLIASLGVEPLSDAFTAAYLKDALSNRKIPIKTALMDNHIVVGIGNIYACETLFKAGISPNRPAQDIKAEELAKITADARKVLTAAIESGGSSLRDYVQTSGEKGYFQHKFFVYGRQHQPCFICSTPIQRIVQSGRSTFYCPACQ